MGTPLTSLATAIFGGKTRTNTIGILFSEPSHSFHIRELARRADVSSAMMTKELKTLERAGIVRAERDGNRVYLQANQDCPIFEELKAISAKVIGVGIAGTIADALAGIPGIKQAFIFGSVAKGSDRTESDVDLAIIETPELSRMDFYSRIAEVQQKLHREIVPQFYSVDDPMIKNDSVVKSIFEGPKIMVINDGK